MDAVTRERQVRACLKSQRYAAEAHEVAASALEVARLASESGREAWLSTAHNAQETAALEAQSAQDRLLNLIASAESVADVEQGEAQPAEPLADRPDSGSNRIEWLFHAIAQLARLSVRRGSAGRA